ncbi:unnamed protein product [Lupinus luteus]|uniref:RRM domain-containing protein n=1 Tax=Lupinus luteus TaxID=3873 RepID=A0AAV1XU72_LUPLU
MREFRRASPSKRVGRPHAKLLRDFRRGRRSVSTPRRVFRPHTLPERDNRRVFRSASPLRRVSRHLDDILRGSRKDFKRVSYASNAPALKSKFSSVGVPSTPPSSFSGVPRPLRGKSDSGHPNGSFSSFYVTNFPEEFGVADLWKLFQKEGRVRDVFIPLKRNSFGKRFAFIRFDKVLNEWEFAQRLDNLRIGN